MTDRRIGPWRSVAAIVVLVLNGMATHGQYVVRGPYLQMPTRDGMSVLWRTNVASNTRLWCGPHPDSLVLVSSSATLVTDHRARIIGLQAATTYYYAVGANGTMLAGADNLHRFRTLPLPGSPQHVRAWALGDFGKGNDHQVGVKQSFETQAAAATDLWIWLGDNVYDNGTDAEYQAKLFQWQGFSDIFRWMPFYPTPGNHDYNAIWQQSALFGIPYSSIALEDHEGPYYDLVEVPQQGEAGGVASGLELFYSFDLGDAHFVSLNSEVYDLLGLSDGIDRMTDWLELDLAQNQRRFTVVYFHQPPYSKGSHDSADWTEFVMAAMRERVVPVLESFDVDLVLGGHSHVYERSHLIHGHYGDPDSFDTATMLRDGSGGDYDAGTPYHKDLLSTTPDGTVYVVCGNGGSSESDAPLDHPVMHHAEGGPGVCGSFLIDIEGERLDGRYLREDGTIGDRFTIIKSATPVGLAEPARHSGLHAFPNPARTMLNVRIECPIRSGMLQLLDATGRSVLFQSCTNEHITLDLNGVANGSYVLLLQTDDGRRSAQVVVKQSE
ncbi:MAG: metallophosphoesterase [Flavobacteriales bacterium]|nr:metallophosphoesterase [Flavobacteriales bacterium]